MELDETLELYCGACGANFEIMFYDWDLEYKELTFYIFTFLHFYIFNPVTILDHNTQVRSGYVPGQYQHLVRVCVPHDEAKLGLISPKGANQT